MNTAIDEVNAKVARIIAYCDSTDPQPAPLDILSRQLIRSLFRTTHGHRKIRILGRTRYSPCLER